MSLAAGIFCWREYLTGAGDPALWKVGHAVRAETGNGRIVKSSGLELFLLTASTVQCGAVQSVENREGRDGEEIILRKLGFLVVIPVLTGWLCSRVVCARILRLFLWDVKWSDCKMSAQWCPVSPGSQLHPALTGVCGAAGLFCCQCGINWARANISVRGRRQGQHHSLHQVKQGRQSATASA